MPVCVVKLCKNNTTRNKKDTGITYHQFPADPVILNRWTNILRLSRQESWWSPGKRSVICSDHFNESDLYLTKGGLKRLCKGAVPQNALFMSTILPDIFFNDITVTIDPSTSEPDINSDNSSVTVDPSTSDAVVNSDNSPVTVYPVVNSNNCEVTADPITSVPVNSNNSVVTEDLSTPVSVVETIFLNEDDDISDIDSVIDTPSNIRLKRELHKKTILQLKHARIIKTLREKVRRLKKTNCSLKSIIKSLKQKRLINNDIYNILSKNVIAADLFNNIYKQHKHKNKVLPKYSNELKKFCLTLNFYSPCAYNYVRSKLGTCLPHAKTLGKWYRNINGIPRSAGNK